MTMADLPAVNASLNGLCAVLLLLGYRFIRRGNTGAHRRCMVAAFCVSVLFVVCYLAYHTYVSYVLKQGPTVFRHPAWFRPWYLAILLSHTVLAVVIVPLVLITLWRGFQGQWEKHRRIAHWTWPLWLYVSATGLLIYLLLYQIFPQG